jgi:two-component system, OmpR family, sensor kinase
LIEVLMRTQRKRHGRFPATRATSVKGATLREAALQARVAELEGEVRTRDDFLAFAAHELRNPLTPISARLELLLAKTRQCAGGAPQGLVQSLERLEALIDAYLQRATNLLEVSRIESGNLRLHATEVELSTLMRQVTANMVPVADIAGCRLRLIVQDGITARCDAMAVEQILENLLSNAIRYGAGGPVEVALASDGKAARLAVRDHGVGISETDQTQIFARFFNQRRTRANAGFGVGLWITQRLVRAIQGQISVSSTPGVGSIFTVLFPLRPDGRDDAL